MRWDYRTSTQVVDDFLAEIEAETEQSPDWAAIDRDILRDATYDIMREKPGWSDDVVDALALVVLRRIQSRRRAPSSTTPKEQGS